VNEAKLPCFSKIVMTFPMISKEKNGFFASVISPAIRTLYFGMFHGEADPE